MKTRVLSVIVALLAASCASMSGLPSGDNAATVVLKNASGQVVGTAKLNQFASGVRVTLEMRGMPPGAHGVHIHDVGKSEPPAFTTAGGHFIPDGKQHGALNPRGRTRGTCPTSPWPRTAPAGSSR